jgi:hypothetical protein
VGRLGAGLCELRAAASSWGDSLCLGGEAHADAFFETITALLKEKEPELAALEGSLRVTQALLDYLE